MATRFTAGFSGFRVLKERAVADPLVSVLVRVKNESSAITRFLEGLHSQDMFARTEVIFLDSGSTDGTLERLLSFPASVYAIAPEEFSFGSSCNLVCSLAVAPVLSLMSGHIALDTPSFLTRAVAALEGEGALVAAYARQVPNRQLGATAYERAYLRRCFRAGDSKQRMDISSQRFSNAASIFTAESWRRIPFADVIASEDHFWAEALMKSGGRILYLPHLTVEHSHNESPQDVYKRVRLNVRARGNCAQWRVAMRYLVGVTGACLMEGAGPAEALRYAWAHARPYLAR